MSAVESCGGSSDRSSRLPTRQLFLASRAFRSGMPRKKSAPGKPPTERKKNREGFSFNLHLRPPSQRKEKKLILSGPRALPLDSHLSIITHPREFSVQFSVQLQLSLESGIQRRKRGKEEETSSQVFMIIEPDEKKNVFF